MSNKPHFATERVANFLAVLGVLASTGVLTANLAAQSSDTSRLVNDELRYMRETLDSSLGALRVAVQGYEQLPSEIEQNLVEAERLAQEFHRNVRLKNLELARRAYQQARRALSRIANWLTIQEDTEQTSRLSPAQRLPRRLERMSARLDKLVRAVGDRTFADDVAIARKFALEANTAISAGDTENATLALERLRDQILRIQEAYSDTRVPPTGSASE
ncbi:MAG: hypothetical protein OEZ06_29815 [Myxococcales bacterium]|nr:hypothetical protein [Myxococcales bacterium]